MKIDSEINRRADRLTVVNLKERKKKERKKEKKRKLFDHWQNHFNVNNKDTIELSVYFWIDFTQHNRFLKFSFATWARFCP